EDGIRDRNVTGVQTCALPILEDCELSRAAGLHRLRFAPGPAPLERFDDVVGSIQPLGLELLVPVERAPELIASLPAADPAQVERSEEHTSELQSRFDLVCRLL